MSYVKLKIDGENVEIIGRYGNVGDTYRLKVYRGCLEVKYYKDKDFKNGINGVIKESEKKSNSLLQK